MQHSIHSRQGLPAEMQALLREHPRDTWPEHPNFARSIQNWMGAHIGFRKLGSIVLRDVDALLEKEKDDAAFAGSLSRYGNLLVGNLHGHHTWEDRKFFPEMAQADPNFESGLNMLEGDHHVLDETLDNFVKQGNRVLKLLELDRPQALEEAKPLRDTSAALSGFLERHLADEEDLVVPIILQHKLRG